MRFGVRRAVLHLGGRRLSLLATLGEGDEDLRLEHLGLGLLLGETRLGLGFLGALPDARLVEIGERGFEGLLSSLLVRLCLEDARGSEA